jgi:SIR2-like domain
MAPPYGVISNLLKKRRVVPFLGAGASMIGRPPGVAWDVKAPDFLPSGLELSHLLADEAEFPSSDEHDRGDLARVASYVANVAGGRPYLRGRLREVLLAGAYRGGELHDFLASEEMPGPLVMVVTNYDTLLEQAFQAAGRAYDLVVYPADRREIANAVLWWKHGDQEPKAVSPNELDIDLERTTVIFKMHGTVHGTVASQSDEWDNFVITEEDYVEFLYRLTFNAAIPSIFYPYFRERSFLFLGYGLRDWNLRVLLKNLSKHLAGDRQLEGDELKSWAIQVHPSHLEERLWQRNNVEIFDCDLNEFVTRLRQRMKI